MTTSLQTDEQGPDPDQPEVIYANWSKLDLN